MYYVIMIFYVASGYMYIWCTEIVSIKY